MVKQRHTKKALLLSALSLLLCVSMLIGTTFAWFTDSVTSANNIIKSGNLDIVLEYWDGDEWKDVKNSSDILSEDLWEPGYVDVAYLRLANAGSLALQYQLGVNIVSETKGVNADGVEFKLSDYLYFDVADVNGETSEFQTREDALLYATQNKKISEGFNDAASLEAGAAPVYFALIVHMPESVGNEANHNGVDVPQIDLGINVFATQFTLEEDSFDEMYDDIAIVATEAELKTAITAGKNVILSDDVVVDSDETATVAAGDKIVLDLNGHNIAGSASETGSNRKLFTVNGEMEVIGEGIISQNFTGANMGWSNLNAVFSVESGELTLGEGVQVLNLGGTDMAYAVDVNTTLGGSVLNINGATLYSPYIAVRIFNNSNTAQGIVNFNAGFVQGDRLTEGKGGRDIWAQNMSHPAENAVVNIVGKTFDTAEDSDEKWYFIEESVSFVCADTIVGALKNGGNFILAGDATLPADSVISVGAGKTSTLDLNGHTLSLSSTRTAVNNSSIDVVGTLSIANGTVEGKHNGSNMAWNGAYSLFNVTAGGVLNLTDVVVENEGGTDMNFAVHLNNWGEVTLNAENCVFVSNYCGIRVFNSGADMNNVALENCTVYGNTRAFWVHNYASADFGGKIYSSATEAYDEAVVAARLNFDIFGNGNEFIISGVAKAAIRYGFNSVIYFDADGNTVA